MFEETKIIRSEGTLEVSFVEGTNSAEARKSVPQGSEARRVDDHLAKAPPGGARSGLRFEVGEDGQAILDRYSSGVPLETGDDGNAPYEGRGWSSIKDRLAGGDGGGGIKDRMAGGAGAAGIQDRMAGGAGDGIQDRLAGGGSGAGIQDRMAGGWAAGGFQDRNAAGDSSGVQDRFAAGDTDGISDRFAAGDSKGIQDRFDGAGSEGISDRYAGGADPKRGSGDRFVSIDQVLVERGRLGPLIPPPVKERSNHRLYEVLAKVPKPVFQPVEMFKDVKKLNERLDTIRDRTAEVRRGLTAELRSAADTRSKGKDSAWLKKKNLPKL